VILKKLFCSKSSSLITAKYRIKRHQGQNTAASRNSIHKEKQVIKQQMEGFSEFCKNFFQLPNECLKMCDILGPGSERPSQKSLHVT